MLRVLFYDRSGFWLCTKRIFNGDGLEALLLAGGAAGLIVLEAAVRCEQAP